ncbi:MAG: type IIL restriction-modification enzyme MmeI [Myxococcota bacterium]
MCFRNFLTSWSYGNALTLDWREVLPPSDSCCILGNPPFVGKKEQTKEQKRDLMAVLKGVQRAGVLDYVAGWYIKAASYIQGTAICCGYVSTNSITQGEQTAVLWHTLLTCYHIKIYFAHRTFVWTSKARGKAAVHCVIIGFTAHNMPRKLLYDYDTPRSNPHEKEVKNINPYLVESSDITIPTRCAPICPTPVIQKGSFTLDGGHLTLSPVEKKEFAQKEPAALPYIKKYVGGREFINNEERYCLWLKDAKPGELRSMPLVLARVERTREFRLASKRETTKRLANTSALFAEIRQPVSDYILVPNLSSERRKYIPIGFFNQRVIANSSSLVLPNATLYHFGVLTSLMHMEWMRHVCGRLKNSYRYSSTLVYNNFPWPQDPTAKCKQAIESKAQAVLDTRAQYPNSTLADLYDPLTMPPPLRKAHQALDKAVDRAYRPQPFTDERSRMEFLLELYQHYTR